MEGEAESDEGGEQWTQQQYKRRRQHSHSALQAAVCACGAWLYLPEEFQEHRGCIQDEMRQSQACPVPGCPSQAVQENLAPTGNPA